MQNIGVTAFDQIRTALPDSAAEIRCDGRVIAAVTDGIELNRDSSELGTMNTSGSNISIKASAELPQSKLTEGRVIEVRHTAAGLGWTKMRIEARKMSAGLILLGLNSQYE